MTSIQAFAFRLWMLVRRREVEADLDEEVRGHLAFATEANLAKGMSPTEAHRLAVHEYGGIDAAKEAYRDARGLGWLEDLARDLRQAVRSLGQRGSRQFTVVGVATVAIGIAATSTLFSVASGLIYDAYPYRDADRILAPRATIAVMPSMPNGGERVTFPPQFIQELATLPSVEEVMVTFAAENLFLAGANGPEPFPYFFISQNGFSFLGVKPLLGRTFEPRDSRPGNYGSYNPTVAVISYKTWQRLFPGNPNPVGEVIELRSAGGAPQRKTVIGVMPPRFGGVPQYGIGDTMWLPLPAVEGFLSAANYPRLRLKPGVTKAAAESEVHVLFTRLAAYRGSPFWTYENGNIVPQVFQTSLRSLADATFDPDGVVRRSFRYLFFGVGFLLLIACVNVAGLQLARAAARRREIAVRLSLGASRSRVIRQLLVESLVLALAGGALGIGLTLATTRIAAALIPANLGSAAVPEEAEIVVNSSVLLVSAALATGCGLLVGLAPAIANTKPDLNATLKDIGRGRSSGGSIRLRGLLVIAEIALSVLLLVGAAISLRAYVGALLVDPGFRPAQLHSGQVALTEQRFPTFYERDAITRELAARLRSIPSIESAAAGVGEDWAQSGFVIGGQGRDQSQRVGVRVADENYADTLGLRIERGRNLTREDVEGREHHALITAAAARLWIDVDDPIGQQINLDVLGRSGPGSLDAADGDPSVTVVGIVGDLRPNVSREAPASVIIPHTLAASGGRFVFRTRSGTTGDVQAEVRKVVRNLDPTLRNAAVTIANLGEAYGDQFTLPRFNFALYSAMASVALALAVAGIYGVFSFHVQQRTRDLGVRIALGADRRAILRSVLVPGARMLAVGIAIGAAAASLLAGFLASRDPALDLPLGDPATLLTIGGALVLMSAAALLACYVPACRATKVDPLLALRCE